jgi:hypothetical protein
VTFFRLLLRNLGYHWRGNLAVFLGVALGTAVLTGALLVGDSLRGSLRALTLNQLGWVEEAMIPGRFFRAALAKELPAGKCSPVILLQGSAATKTERSNRVTVLGVDSSFWPADAVPVGADFWQSQAAEVVLNRALADALHVREGDTITLGLHKIEDVPRESLLGKRKAEDVVQPVPVKVRHVLSKAGMARFTLRPTPEPVQNAFVLLGFLQAKLDQPGLANALLGAGLKEPTQGQLALHLTLDDWGLRLRSPKDRALALVHFLDPRNDDGKLKRARWTGRVPDVLARHAV